jgi:membrane protein DedA with SNARE-associated domain
MLQLIGTFIDNLILIMAGVLILSKVKIMNKPYMKWIAILLILIGLVLTAKDIHDLAE